MSNTTVVMADMGILVGIFLLGFLAKMFRKDRVQGSGVRGRGVRE